jgi:hypothetical protein
MNFQLAFWTSDQTYGSFIVCPGVRPPLSPEFSAFQREMNNFQISRKKDVRKKKEHSERVINRHEITDMADITIWIMLLFPCCCSSSTFLIGPSGLFLIRINLELWILQTVGRIPWTGDQPCRQAAAYAGQHKQRRNANRHPCHEWDSNPRSQCLSGCFLLKFVTVLISFSFI